MLQDELDNALAIIRNGVYSCVLMSMLSVERVIKQRYCILMQDLCHLDKFPFARDWTTATRLRSMLASAIVIFNVSDALNIAKR